MPLIEEIMAYRDLGIGALSLILIYSFAKWTSDRAFQEITESNKRANAAQERFSLFIESSYKENTKTMSDLISTFEDHVKTKDKAIEMLEEQQEMLFKDRLRPKEYRKYSY